MNQQAPSSLDKFKFAEDKSRKDKFHQIVYSCRADAFQDCLRIIFLTV